MNTSGIKRRKGQSLTEYGLGIALIIALIFVAMPAFGNAVNQVFCYVNGRV